jgi:streptomycin 6-kinase
VDLHAGNVLATQREPWLVIDPKPFIGDPAFDAGCLRAAPRSHSTT